MTSSFVLIATLAVVPAVLRAQSFSFEGRTIVQVQILPPYVLHPADLERIGVLEAGAVLETEAVSAQIDRLFATGEFDDIRADAELTPAGVRLAFVTTPKRYLASISIRGRRADPPNHGELATAPRLAIGASFREADVQTAAGSIQQMFTSNGLYEAAVRPEVRFDDSGRQAFLRFHVRPGKRARYEEPEIRGEAILSTRSILRATGWRVRFVHFWRDVTEERTRRGLQGILKKYQEEDRLRARVELDGLDYDPRRRRVQPRLTLNAGPKIEIATTETKVSGRILRRYVPVFQERTVDHDLLAEGARNLRDYFQSQGYFDATVDFRTLNVQPDLERIEYAISRGSRYKMVHLEITGNRYFDQQTIRERMFLEPSSFYLRRGRYSEAFRRKDEENIANLYRSNGFRDVRVDARPIRRYGNEPNQIGVVVQIDEGRQWLVDAVMLEGLGLDDRAVLEPNLASLAGQPFSEVNIAADRNYMLNFFSRNGYPLADVRGAWRVTGQHRVEVLYQVQPGPRQYVRDIFLTGLGQTRRRLAEERLTLTPGAPLDAIALRQGQKNLYDMGIFARVNTAVENPEGSTTRKTILYSVEEANRYTASLGLGAQVGRFGTPSNTDISSAGGATGFSPLVSLNVSRLNFLGIGHTVSARGVYSSLQKRGSVSYFAPRFQNIEGRSLVVSLLYDQTRDVRTFSSRRQEASVQASQRFSRSTTGMFRFAYRRVSVGDVVIPALLVPQLLQPVRLGILSADLARDRRDDSADAHRGSYNTFNAGISTRFIGSQRSFVRMLVRNATYHPVTSRFTFARQTQFGWISPFAAPAGLPEAASVPLPERFFGGGADSLRAFPFNQAGPRDTGASLSGATASQATGFPLGGNALVFNSAELRFPLIGRNIQGVLFHDIGNIYSTIGDISFRLTQRSIDDFRYAVQAAGVGVRYRTPIGPVRVDLAYSINPPRYLGFSGTAADLLQCGPAPTSSACQSTPQRVSHFQFFFSIGQTF